MHYGIEKDCEVCFYCMKKVSKLTAGKNKEPAYISVEFKNWKKTPEGFKDHQNSKCHKEAEHCVKSVRIRTILVRIFPAFCRIRRDTPYLSVFSPNVRKCGKNADQNNSEYGHFLRSGNHGSYHLRENWTCVKLVMTLYQRMMKFTTNLDDLLRFILFRSWDIFS